MKPVNNLLNQQFGHLIIISRAPNPGTRKNDTAAYWKCQCECGKITTVRGYSLTTGKTQSCGCLKLEAPHLVQFQEPKYTSEIAAAKVIWKRRNRYSELSFDDFYRLSQQNCYYCLAAPSIIVYGRQKDISQAFTYNTLDRINSSLGHTLDNVVPACLICNRSKLDRSIEEFWQYLRNVADTIRITPEEYRNQSLLIDLSPLYDENRYAYITSAKATNYLYKDGNLSLEQFYQLSQMNCYYCRAAPSNRRNLASKQSSDYAKETGNFIYNGLDRIDNNLPHIYDNTVPCCKYCNTAKGDLALQEFENWINRLRV